MSSSKSYISCQYVTAVQQCCSGGRLPFCIKDTRSFWRQSFSCSNHFFSRYLENCSVLTSQFAVHAEGEKVGIIKDLRYWEAHSKAHSTDIVIWWKYLIETKLWMSECWLRCRFHSQESLRPSRGQSAQTLCSLSRAHTHTHIQTFTHIQTYKHTYILICTHTQTLL